MDNKQLTTSKLSAVIDNQLALPTRVEIKLAGGPIITIRADGTVEAPSLEHASEAGRVLVDSMRAHLRGAI